MRVYLIYLSIQAVLWVTRRPLLRHVFLLIFTSKKATNTLEMLGQDITYNRRSKRLQVIIHSKVTVALIDAMGCIENSICNSADNTHSSYSHLSADSKNISAEASVNISTIEYDHTESNIV